MQELTDECVEKSGLRAHYTAEREGADRLENLAELVNATAQFQDEYEGEDTSLIGFLTHASLEAGEHEAGVNDDALQLMTVHAAKGLEFKAVFLSGLEEGLFPHDNSVNSFDGVEEERRLMYVAVTRARERLYLSYAGQRMLHGQMRYGIVSRFVDEIPAPLCKWIVVSEKQSGYLAGSQVYPNARAVGNYQAEQSWGGGRRDAASRGAWSEGRESSDRPYSPAQQNNSVVSTFGREGAPDTSRARFETARPDAYPFGVGQNVRHTKFGEGVVLNFEGRGLDARVQVKFRSEGVKWLALQYAKLTAA